MKKLIPIFILFLSCTKSDIIVSTPETNTNTPQIRIVNYKNYLSPSYELRASDLWSTFNSCADVIADFNGDGYDELFSPPSSTNNARKGIVGDFNGDKKPDIIYAEQGVDSPPFNGSEQTILLSTQSGFIRDTLPGGKWFAHGICSGDIDNDGDLDVFIVGKKIMLLINNGLSKFTIRNINISEYGRYTCEMKDINKDGFIDLVLSGHDFDSDPMNKPTTIYWGNGKDFNENRLTQLPRLNGWGIVVDINFYNNKIVLLRTREGQNYYKGSRIQIIENDSDATSKYIQNETININNWLVWLRVGDIDKNGKMDIFDTNKGTGYRWEQDSDSVFKRK